MSAARSGTPIRAAARAVGPGREAQGGGGDDAEGAFGPDEQLLEIRAEVVLAQGREAVPEGSVGEHDLEAEHLLAHHAVAQHVDAAGVGRDDAADLAGALRADRDRQEQVARGDGVLDRLEDAAGLDDAGVVVGVDRRGCGSRRDEAEHDLGGSVGGEGAVDEAGVAALGHDAERKPGAGADHRLDLRRHRAGAAPRAPRPSRRRTSRSGTAPWPRDRRRSGRRRIRSGASRAFRAWRPPRRSGTSVLAEAELPGKRRAC